MKHTLFTLAICIALAGPTTALADQRPDHFQGLPANTLEDALTNFSEYNGRLAALLDTDQFTDEDMVRIHQLTYTLENALEKIIADLDALADTLEELHLASETARYEDARRHGRAYLDVARQIVP
ncbi:MAG: hypothetical protein JJT90_12495 [Ectothiorhodospiraceae bacterium]|nr:hypothetical protein [Ectothiorhodospiraceae bacterium]